MTKAATGITGKAPQTWKENTPGVQFVFADWKLHDEDLYLIVSKDLFFFFFCFSIKKCNTGSLPQGNPGKLKETQEYFKMAAVFL